MVSEKYHLETLCRSDFSILPEHTCNLHTCLRCTEWYSLCVHDLCTYMCFQFLLHSRGHHDNTDDGDQQEIEGIHESGPCWLFDLGAAVTAAWAGCRATAAGQLHAKNSGEKRQKHYNQSLNFPHQLSGQGWSMYYSWREQISWRLPNCYIFSHTTKKILEKEKKKKYEKWRLYSYTITQISTFIHIKKFKS